jgi:lysophospholipase L1-like esterase
LTIAQTVSKLAGRQIGGFWRTVMKLWFGILIACVLCSVAAAQDSSAQKPQGSKLPVVVLFGDSIRLSYAPEVTKQLAGQAKVESVPYNGSDSANVLRKIEDWAIRVQPDIVHFNCGIHDTKKSKTTGKFQVSPEEYEKNLRAIVERLRKETKAKVLFALTTPIHDERAAKTRAERDYELLNASTEQYNEIARRVMKELDVPVDDLRKPLGDPDEQARYLVDDGVHLNKQGVEKLGTTVAQFVKQHLPAATNADTK